MCSEDAFAATAIVFGFLGFIIAGGIFAVFSSLAGQTPGMRSLAIRVTYDGSRDMTPGLAVKRVLVLVVSLLPAGLGYFAMCATRAEEPGTIA